jgi:hydroxyacid-oxoacid transhydrogenase
MACFHESAFSIEAPRIVFGRGALAELGDHARAFGLRRVALFTDARLAKGPHVQAAREALKGLDVAVYDEVKVEPTDASFLAAVPGPLPPHIACPTTCGTGAETTGIAVCDVLALHAKTGIASPRLRPALAVVDPDCCATLPSQVVAASGFDVLCHALESFTSRPFTARDRPRPFSSRPMSQGHNPWSDLGSREALRLTGAFLVRAVRDPSDREARDQLSWAATLAGVAFGNAGVHLPHGMAYAVAGLVRDFRMAGYPAEEPMVPHGVSVVVSAPSVFRFTASAAPERHLEAAQLLGAEVRGAAPSDAGEIVARTLEKAMQETAIPNGLKGVGYGDSDVPGLVKGTIVQQRLLANAPLQVGEPELADLFRGAMRYW